MADAISLGLFSAFVVGLIIWILTDTPRCEYPCPFCGETKSIGPGYIPHFHCEAELLDYIAARRTEALSVVGIADELIDFVISRYGVTSLDGFTCPIHRRLAQALGKFSE